MLRITSRLFVNQGGQFMGGVPYKMLDYLGVLGVAIGLQFVGNVTQCSDTGQLAYKEVL
jgi:hypothetical protein